MKFSILSIFIVACVSPICFVQICRAQIIEECFWECGVEYCDYLDDYCTYDCHEICYPISRKSPFEAIIPDGSIRPSGPSDFPHKPIVQTAQKLIQPNQRQNLTEGLSLNRVHDQLAVINKEVSSNMGMIDSGRIGKHVKMRIENPAYETVRRGKVVLTRGSPPRGFAMFQDCLSASKHKQPTSPSKENESLGSQQKEPL